MYNIVAKVVDNNNCLLGYKIKFEKQYKFRKHLTNDIITLIKNGEILNAALSKNNEVLITNYNEASICTEIHNINKYITRIDYILYSGNGNILKHDRLQNVSSTEKDAIDSVEKQLCGSKSIGISMSNLVCEQLRRKRLDNSGILALSEKDIGNKKLVVFVTIQEYCNEVNILKLDSLNSYLLGTQRAHISEIGLESIAHYLNIVCFGGAICLDNIDWNNRLISSAGNSGITRVDGVRYRRIKMSPFYHDRHRDEIIPTILHELVHQLPGCMNHSALFMAMCNRLSEYGIDVSRFAKESAVVRYIYTCNDCGYEYKRSKRISNESGSMCSICKGKLSRRDL